MRRGSNDIAKGCARPLKLTAFAALTRLTPTL
jgi:hypothetical protein